MWSLLFRYFDKGGSANGGASVSLGESLCDLSHLIAEAQTKFVEVSPVAVALLVVRTPSTIREASHECLFEGFTFVELDVGRRVFRDVVWT